MIRPHSDFVSLNNRRRSSNRLWFYAGVTLLIATHRFELQSSKLQAQEASVRSHHEQESVEVKKARVVLIDRVTLASPRAGILAFVEVREGDSVNATQVIAGLDSEVAKAALQIAKHRGSSTVDRRFAKKSIDLAQAEYDRADQANHRVKGNPVFNDIDMHRLQLTVDKTKLQLEQAESEAVIHSLTVNQLTAELNSLSIVAPFEGIVTKVYRSRGEAVGLGDPIAEIVSLGRVRVEGFVEVQAGLKVKPGSPVFVRLDLPNVELEEEHLELQGKLVFVDVGVEPVSGQIRVWAEVPNPNGILRAGMPARLTITLKTGNRSTD